MQHVTRKATVVFARPFRVPGLEEVLPAGEYAVEAEITAPDGVAGPQGGAVSVLIHLHAVPANPGLARTLTIPLADLERALEEDRLSGQPLAEFLLDELLADPLVRLVMASDHVTEGQMRRLYSGLKAGTEAPDDR
jgi:hypothetical protein